MTPVVKRISRKAYTPPVRLAISNASQFWAVYVAAVILDVLADHTDPSSIYQISQTQSLLIQYMYYCNWGLFKQHNVHTRKIPLASPLRLGKSSRWYIDILYLHAIYNGVSGTCKWICCWQILLLINWYSGTCPSKLFWYSTIDR